MGLRSGGSDDECDSEMGESLEAIARANSSAEDYDESSTCTATIPEFAWQEEPRSPPSRLSFCETPEWNPSSDIDDDAVSVYSQFSAAYTFRSRSVRRKNGRLSRRTTAMSMMSVYSQSSISSQDAMDLPPIPSLPWGLRGDLIAEDAENDLGEEMTFGAPEYAYAYSLDEYVGHGLEGAALAGRTTARSGVDFEAELPSILHSEISTSVATNTGRRDDWRASLTANGKGKGKRRTSSNISVVGLIPTAQDPELAPRLAFADGSSITTNGSISDVSTTSTLTPMSPRTLTPNRRQRTIRRGTTSPPSSPRSNYQPPSSTSANFIFDTETGHGGWRREIPPGSGASFPSPEDNMKQARGVRLGLQEMKSRVGGLKSRLISLTLRSPSSPTFPSGLSSNFYDHRSGPDPSISRHPPNSPSGFSKWPSASVSPSVSSSSSSSGTSEASPPSSASSSWTPGLTNRNALFLSPSATPSTIPMAI